MNDDGDYSLDSRHRFTKQQLSTLGYNYEFSNDVLPLLENLVSDLLQTTDNLKHYKDLSRNCLEACHDLETFLDAYKKDNAWLIQELNTLHLNTLSERTEYEARITELKRSIKISDTAEPTGYVKSRSRSCLRHSEKPSFSTLKNEIPNLKEDIKNREAEIKRLQTEILRLNNLLSGGRPLEAILKDGSYDYEYNKLRNHLNKTIIGQHEAKRNAIRLAELYDHHIPDSTNDNTAFCDNEVHHISENNETNTPVKLKSIEQELNKLKIKYQKLEADTKRNDKRSITELEESKSKELSTVKDKCHNLELEKNKLCDEVEKLNKFCESTKSMYTKLEKELHEMKRSNQELSADKSDRDKLLKKFQEDKKHLLNRIQELSIIERDLTLEVTRLCNVNAVHKRHILELENKLLDVSVCKGKATLSSLKPEIMKKPLERRTVGGARNKENIADLAESSLDKEKVSNVLSKIREKYNQQIENSKVDYRNHPIRTTEFQADQDNTVKTVTFIDDIKILNEKVDSLKNVLVEKEKTLSNLLSENQKLNHAFNEINLQNAVQKTLHACDQCIFAEKLISEYKEKLIKLEAEKRDLLVRHSECPKIIDCNKQHIMQLRSELHRVQLELQQYKTNSGQYTRLEEETNFTVESSRAVQKQLEMQLESSQNKVQLLEKDYNNLKSELLSLRDAKLKLQKSVIDLEMGKDQLATSVEEKSKKVNVLEKLLKAKEVKLANLQQLVDEQQKQLSSTFLKLDSKKMSASIEHLRVQIKNLERSRDQAVTHNGRLERQLTDLKKDHDACRRDLKKAKSEAELLKTQVHDYIAKVRAAEDTLQHKSKERSEMLDHFRTLTVEATQLESNNQTLESEARSTRNALRNAESRITDLEHVIQNKDALVAGYEEQLNDLTKTVASLEAKILNLTDQRDRFQAELDSCELLSNQMDNSRDYSSTSQLSNKRFQDEILRLQSENRRLQKSVSQEKLNVSALESILSASRNDATDPNISNIELQEEIRGLKANIKCLQESLETTSKQLRKTQNEAADYQKQVIQLNRELRMLQFECVRNSSDHSINYTTL